MIALFSLGLVLIAVCVMAYFYLRSDPIARGRFREEVRMNFSIILILLVLSLAPMISMVPSTIRLPAAAFCGIVLAWGVLHAAFWDREVAPVSLLQATPQLPGAAVVDHAPTLPTVLPPRIEGDVLKTFRWQYKAMEGVPVEMSLQLSLSTTRFQAARAESRLPLGEWGQYAVADMPELDALAYEFYRLNAGRGWSSLDQAGNVLAFIQTCIQYQSDADTTPLPEWPRYPIETLYEEAGDCEDGAILASAVLKRLGFEVALLYYPQHCALGIAGAEGLPGEYVIEKRQNLRFFYGETTAEGWHLGEIPDRYRGKAPDKIELVVRKVTDAK